MHKCRNKCGETPWLNWIEQPPPKGQVGGSNPLGVTIYSRKISKMRHSTSVRMQLPSGFSVPNHRTEEERRYKSRTGGTHLRRSGATNPHEKPRLVSRAKNKGPKRQKKGAKRHACGAYLHGACFAPSTDQFAMSNSARAPGESEPFDML